MWTKENICCDRFVSAYVNMGNTDINEPRPFLSQGEIEINRHLELIKKMMKGRDKILQIPLNGEIPEEIFDACRSGLKEEGVTEKLLQLIADNCSREENYCIIMYHLMYDIPKKGTDGKSQDDSEEVYEHLLCIICPTKKTKTCLAVEDGTLTLTRQNRVVCAPATGIIWPAFDDGKEDRNAIIVYNADDKKPCRLLHINTFHAKDYRTTEELRGSLKDMFLGVFKQEDTATKVQMMFTEQLGNLGGELIMSRDMFAAVTKELANHHGVTGIQAELLNQYYDKYLADFQPSVHQLLDPMFVKKSVAREKGSKMRKLLLRAAAAIEDTQGTESELVRDLLSAADMQTI